MSPEQQTPISGKSHKHILDLVLFCHKRNFSSVKQQNEVHHVKLGIFLSHLHMKFIKIRVTVI